MPDNPEVHIGPALLAGIAALLLLAGLLFRRLARKEAAGRGTTSGPDWSVPALDAYADRRSFFHDWDPRLKIGALFLYCFGVASLQTLTGGTAALAIALAAVVACRIPMRRALRRLGAMAGFLAMFLVVLPLTAPLRPGETLVYLPLLEDFPLHGAGFVLALTIVCKASAIALMMEPLLGTASLPVTLQGLSRLGLPESICQMILLSHRYIFVFLHEAKRLYRSLRVRGFRPRTDLATMNTMGNFFGMLFVSSFDRTQRVHDAMLSRGYNGVFPTYIRFRTTGKDWAKAVFWGIVGCGLVFLDRML